MSREQAEWNANDEKLLCMIVLRDSLAEKMNLTQPGNTYWRAFIVEQRQDKTIYAKFRYNQGGERNWYIITPKDQDNPAEYLRAKLTQVMRLGLQDFGASKEDIATAFEFFYPPDDGGDGTNTIRWLIEKDLITVRAATFGDPAVDGLHDTGV
jgi:hypothetical protein